MVAVLNLIDDGGQFAFGLAAQPHAEDLADPVGGQSPESEFAGTFEDFVDGEVPLEDEVAAVFDLGDGVEPRQIHLLPLLGGKLRPQQKGPVVESLANDLRTEPVCGGLEFGGIIDGQEGIVVLAETDLGMPQFLFDEGMAVEIVGGALAEDLLADHGQAQDLTEKMDYLLGPRQAAQITVDDDAIEAMVYKDKQVAEELGKQFHWLHLRIPTM